MTAGTRETVLSDAHRAYLAAHAVSDQAVAATGLFSYGDEIVFPWRDNGLETLQQRTWPEPEEGLPPGVPKYRWETGHPLHFAAWRPAGVLPADAPVIIAEGTKQSLAVASWAPGEYAVYGMAGCDGWRDLAATGLHRFAGHKVIIMLDADAGDNLSVYEAGELLATELESEGAVPGFVPSPAWGTQGIDDYLARFPGRETEKLAKLLASAQPKPAERRPTRRKMGDVLPDTGDRPLVAVNADRALVIRQLLGRMRELWDPRGGGAAELFSFGGALTRLRWAASGDHQFSVAAEPLDRDSLARWVAEAAFTCVYKPPGQASPGTYTPAWPEQQTMGAILASGDEFAALDRISRTPLVRPDGSVCAKNGYDEPSRTMLALGNSGMDRLDIPDDPSPGQAAGAADYLLGEWLGDMPFRDESSRANALALVLTPFIRGLVPLVPLAVVSGLQPGVGKNLLADCISLMITGEAAPPLPWIPDDDDENRKQITSAFRAGAPLLIFDEAHEIGGTALTRAITSITYADRILGVSKMAAFPNRVTWMALGNQVRVNADMARRAYYVDLYPDVPDPESRPAEAFAHPELRSWTSGSRPELVTAALVLIRAWYAAGCPEYRRGSLMGSFEEWDRIMSGILGNAGVPGFLNRLAERRQETDTSGGYWSEHLAWLAGLFGGAEFTVMDVAQRAASSGGSWDSPPRLDDPAERGFARNLGAAYGSVSGRYFGRYRLEKLGIGHRKVQRWRVTDRYAGQQSSGPVTGIPPIPPSLPASGTMPDLGGRDAEGYATPRAYASAPARERVREETGSFGQTLPDLGQSGPAAIPPGNTPGIVPGHSGREGLEVLEGSLYPNVIRAGAGAHPHTHTHTRGGESERLPSAPSDPSAGPVLGFDLETGWAGQLFTRERGYRLADGTGFVRLCGITGPSGQNMIVPLPQLLPLLQAAGAVYGHNILGFDGLALAWHEGADWDAFCATARDTELIARQAYPPRSREKGHSEDKLGLDAVAALLAVPGKTDNLKRLAAAHGGMDTIPAGDPEFRSYLEGDLDATRGVAAQLLPYYDTDPYLPREHKLAQITGHMSLTGLAVDTGLLTQRLAAGEQRKRDALQALHDGWGLPLGRTVLRGRGKDRHEEDQEFSSPLATGEGLAWLEGMYLRYQVPDPPRTAKTGKLATSADELAQIARDPACPPALRAMLALMAIVTTTRTVYQTAQAWLAPDGRVHPRISARQASGRWSFTEPGLTVYGKHEGRHVERDIFVASEGNVLLSFDLRTVDMRAIAALSQDPAYMALFEEGRDAHSEIAARVFGDAPRDAKGRHPRRQDAKARGHGWNYGMGPDRMIRDGVPPDMAYGFDDGMKAAFTVMCDWREHIRDYARGGGVLDNGFGRRMRADPRHAHTVAPALMGQGGARDIMGECLIRLDPALYPALIGLVHDEILLDVPIPDAEEAAAECRRAMTWTWRDVPILCDQAGPARSWGDLSAKG